MQRNLKINDYIVLTTTSSETYRGEVIAFNSPESITLHNLFRQDTWTQIKFPVTFQAAEIEEIIKFTKQRSDSPTTSYPTAIDIKKSKISLEKFTQIYNNILNYKLIWKKDSAYSDAVRNLEKAGYIGVAEFRRTLNRGQRIEYLACSTLRNIYIFDFGNIDDCGSLLDILMSESVKKVVFNGFALYDCLFHNYKLRMRNICDIHLIRKKRNEMKCFKSLSDALNYYFIFPKSLLLTYEEVRASVVDTETIMLKTHLARAAELVSYLPMLFEQYLKTINEEHHKRLATVIMECNESNICEIWKFVRCCRLILWMNFKNIGFVCQIKNMDCLEFLLGQVQLVYWNMLLTNQNQSKTLD